MQILLVLSLSQSACDLGKPKIEYGSHNTKLEQNNGYAYGYQHRNYELEQKLSDNSMYWDEECDPQNLDDGEIPGDLCDEVEAYLNSNN